MNRYWLSRGPGMQAEGPFFFGQLWTMFEAGQLTAEAQVCRHGEEDWFLLHDEIDAVLQMERQMKPKVARSLSYEEALQKRDAEQAASYGSVINWVTAGICLIGFVPAIGLVAFLIWGLWVLVATVLCVMQMSRGRVASGIWNLIGVWIFAPFVIAGLQFVSLKLLSAAS